MDRCSAQRRSGSVSGLRMAESDPAFGCAAQLQAGRNVILALQPGTHIFRSSDKKEPVSLDLKQGERYFVRIDVSLVALKGHGKVVLVLPEQGAAEYAQTKPADKKMVKGRTLIAPEFTAK